MSGIEIHGLRETVQALREAGETIRRQIPYVMRQATLIVERRAKQVVPVDTGRLRSSITSEVTGVAMETTGVVGSNVEYAPYVELGTERMKAQPYLARAMEEKTQEVIKLFLDFVHSLKV